jgi:L-glyceraldehyde 3-phosphate reductase
MRYNIFSRSYDKDGLFGLLVEKGVGGIAFSPLAQGLLSDKYLRGIPEGSRATREHFLKSSTITPELLSKIRALNDIAARRGQTLPQMAVA